MNWTKLAAGSTAPRGFAARAGAGEASPGAAAADSVVVTVFVPDAPADVTVVVVVGITSMSWWIETPQFPSKLLWGGGRTNHACRLLRHQLWTPPERARGILGCAQGSFRVCLFHAMVFPRAAQ